MNDTDKKHLLILRFFLIAAALAWGCSVLGLVVSWPIVEKQLTEYSAVFAEGDIMIPYWLRMAAAVYTLAGCFYVIIAVKPVRYRAVIGPIGYMHLALTAILLTNGLILGVDAIPLYVDTGFCLCTGLGITATNIKLQKYFKTSQFPNNPD